MFVGIIVFHIYQYENRWEGLVLCRINKIAHSRDEFEDLKTCSRQVRFVFYNISMFNEDALSVQCVSVSVVF